MTYIARRFENFRQNGMHGWARSRPAYIRTLLFVPCLIEYLAFSLLYLAGFAVLIVLMALAAIFRLDDEPEARRPR
ncbi:MAG: hypothetical protein AAAC47_28100 [Pararhizobium sp.]